MKYWLLILSALLLIATGLFAFTRTQAQCEGEPATAGDDTIVCTAENSNDYDVVGDSGNDTIIIQPGATGVEGDLAVIGDEYGGPGAGDDYIVNNGSVESIYGDAYDGIGSGNDTIINNGTVNYDIYADGGDDTVINNGSVGYVTGAEGNDTIVNNGTVDYTFEGGDGNDTLINNGVSNTTITGDNSEGAGTGNDVIINNGLAVENIVGDSEFEDSSGNDTIINTGQVNGTIYGDSETANGTGNDTIVNSGTVGGGIDAGGGNDAVVLQNFGTVNGMVDGGAGFDTLQFDISSADYDQLLEWADQIFAANPNGGTITLNGVTYTWVNFEELVQLLNLAALNGNTAPMQGFCLPDGSFEVWRIISATEGEFAFRVTPAEVALAFEDLSVNRIIASDGDLSLWVLTSGELQMNAPNYDFAFDYEATCGALPDVDFIIQAQPEDIDQLPPYTVINRPFQ